MNGVLGRCVHKIKLIDLSHGMRDQKAHLFKKAFFLVCYMVVPLLLNLSAYAGSSISPQQVAARWKASGGRVLMEQKFKFENHWSSPPALNYRLWVKAPCRSLRQCKKYPGTFVKRDTRREFHFRIGNPGWLLVIGETWSTHTMHPSLTLQYLDKNTGQWREFLCERTQGVRTYKHGENNAAWLAMYDPSEFPKTRCYVRHDSQFRVVVLAPWSFDGRERFKARGSIWVLFSPEGRSAPVKTFSWVRSLHRKTYQAISLPFNYRVVLNPVLLAWRRVRLPDTNWGCNNCEAFYATIVRGRPSSLAFRYASDNTARLYVNGVMVFEEDFGNRDWCTGRPCCSGCCDTLANCRRVLSGSVWHYLRQDLLKRYFTSGDNVIVWRIRNDGGGSGFYCQMRVSGAVPVRPAPKGDVTGF